MPIIKKKISEKYWYSLNRFEQDYIESRIHKEDLPSLKMVIADARKQHPDYFEVYGNGFIKTPNGVFMHSGSDTRRFLPVK